MSANEHPRTPDWRFLVRPAWLFSGARDSVLDLLSSRSQTEFAHLYRTVRPYTMSGHVRLRALYRAVRHVIASGVPGALVECGTARGGSAALMGLTAQYLEADRTVWVFDTFEGIPPPTTADPDWQIAQQYTGSFRASVSEVKALLNQLGIIQRYKMIKGLLQETLPTCGVEAIALLHLDCDWYESVRCCLEHLYDRVSPGGIIQIDDYGHWQGAKKAVDEFLRDRQLDVRLRWLDYTGRQLIKPGEVSGRPYLSRFTLP